MTPPNVFDSPVFVRTKHYDYLAGILLAVTGCEAMFAKYVLPPQPLCNSS